MKPHIDRTEFGSITVDGETYGHDIVIRLSGNVKKRRRSCQRNGTALRTPCPWKKPNTSTTTVLNR